MDIAYTFSDVLIEPSYSDITSRTDVDISSKFTNKFGKEFIFKLPVISANMKNITGPKMAKEIISHGGLGILHRFNTVNEAVEDFKAVDHEYAGVSIGVQLEDHGRFDSLYKAGARIFCIDVAHGHHILVKNMIQWIRRTKKKHDEMLIIAGNIATDWAAIDLIKWGADVVKVGIGPGSVCQTRNNTGCGVPQLYALERIRQTINSQAQIIADGGITTVGDIAKALKYADMVMLGGFIAGTSETPGNAYKGPDAQYYKVYGGSASGENKGKNTFVEGMTKTVPFRGKVKYILREIDDGLRSAFSYTGSRNMIEFKENCKFNFISGGGVKESKF